MRNHEPSLHDNRAKVPSCNSRQYPNLEQSQGKTARFFMIPLTGSKEPD